MSDLFEMVGVKPELAEQQVPEKENRWYDTIPWLSVIILILIVGGCLFCNRIMTKDPSYMDLKNYTIAPCKEFLFGTDTMGRDIFSMGKYAVTVRKSTAYRCLVDYPDSRCFSCCDTIVHYQYWRLYQKKIK